MQQSRDAAVTGSMTSRGTRTLALNWADLTSDGVDRWITSIARRRLRSTERNALPLRAFAGAAGLAQLNIDPIEIGVRPSESFEALQWEIASPGVTVGAVLLSSCDFARAPQTRIATTPNVSLVAVLSGSIEMIAGSARRRYHAGDVVETVPGTTCASRSEDPLGLLYLRIRTPQVRRRNREIEPNRLHVAADLARVMLVDELGRFGQMARTVRLLRESLGVFEPTPPPSRNRGAKEDGLRARVSGLIEVAHTDPAFSVDDIAERLSMSRRHLSRQFEGTAAGLAEQLTERRLQSALGAMELDPALTLDGVAAQSGFGSAKNLRRAFVRRFGVTPTVWRSR